MLHIVRPEFIPMTINIVPKPVSDPKQVHIAIETAPSKQDEQLLPPIMIMNVPEKHE